MLKDIAGAKAVLATFTADYRSFVRPNLRQFNLFTSETNPRYLGNHPMCSDTSARHPMPSTDCGGLYETHHADWAAVTTKASLNYSYT